MSLTEILRQSFQLGQLVSETLAFAIILGIALVIAWIGHTIFKRYLLRLAIRTKSNLDDTILNNIRAPIFILALLFGVYYGLLEVSFLNNYSDIFSSIFTISEILVVSFIFTRVANVFINWYGENRLKRRKKVSNHLLIILKKVIQILVFLLLF